MASTIPQPVADLSVLSSKEMKALEDMRAAFADADYPDKTEPESWFKLNDWTYLRYLRARGYNVEKAKAMLEATLEFRRKYNPFKISCDEEEVKLGLAEKVWRLLPPGKDASPVQITYAALFDAGKIVSEEGFIRTVAYESELVLKEMVKTGWKSDRTIVIFEMQDYSIMKQANPTAMRYIKQMLEVNDHHYPEMLRKAVIFNAPFVFRGVWAIIKPWLDKTTTDRVIFVSDKAQLLEFIDAEILIEAHGGTRKAEYPVVYFEEQS